MCEKKTAALILAAAVALGNCTPIRAAAGDTPNTTPGNDEAYQALTFDFNDAVLEVTGSDGQQKKKCVTNNVTFTSNTGHTNVGLVDAPTVEGDTTPRGKALKFNKSSAADTCLTTDPGTLTNYDFSAGVK